MLSMTTDSLPGTPPKFIRGSYLQEVVFGQINTEWIAVTNPVAIHRGLGKEVLVNSVQTRKDMSVSIQFIYETVCASTTYMPINFNPQRILP